VASLDSKEKPRDFAIISVNILEQGKFERRGWDWNSKDRQQADEKDVSILGVMWNVNKDQLKSDIAGAQTISGEITKRKIFSTAQRIFDPLRFVPPVTIVPKTMLQKLCEIKLYRDEPVPDEVAKTFKKWLQSLESLSRLDFPRWIMKGSVHKSKFQLHLICGASKDAYGCCIYLRSQWEPENYVQLIIAKSSVAPKKSTIPRLELLACGIGSRLLSNAKQEMDFHDVDTHCWTDSSNALYWIQNNENWATFVFNRVQESES